MLPNFVILGAQKSATTFVLRCLGEHPQVFMVPDEVFCFEDPEYARFDPRELERLFEGATGQTAFGIKRADYLAKPIVPARIHRHLPGARLIAVLREPVARALSAYFYYVKLGLLPVLPLDEGMALLLDRTMPPEYSRAPDILEYGRYQPQLERYLELFPRDRLLILVQEELARDNAGAMRSVYDFLGVDADFAPRGVGRSSNPGVYSMTRLRWLARRNRFMYRYDGEHSRAERRRLSPLGLAWAGSITLLDRLLLSRLFGNPRPALRASLRERLEALYAPDVEALERLLGRALPDWRRQR